MTATQFSSNSTYWSSSEWNKYTGWGGTFNNINGNLKENLKTPAEHGVRFVRDI